MGDNSVLAKVVADVKTGVEKAEKKWKDSKWEGFVEKVALWLLDEKKEDGDDVAAAVTGLIVYGATTEEKLQRVGMGEYMKFKETLSAEGVPKAICDLLFERYAGGESAGKKKKRPGSGGLDGSQAAVKRQAVGEGEFFASITKCEILSSSVHKFPQRIVDSSGKHLLFMRDCYVPLYNKVVDLAPERDAVIVTGTSGVGKTFLGVST